MLDDFTHKVLSCTTAAGVGELFGREIARHGYTSSSCVVIAPSGERPRAGDAPRDFLFRNWSKEWVRVSGQGGFPVKRFAAVEKDLIVGEGRRRRMPFAWQEVAQRGLKPVEAEVFDALSACGWHDGLLVPMHGPAGYFAMVAMASPERDLDLGRNRRGHLQTAAMLAHERALALSQFAQGGPSEPLSARELECMRWVAAGKTDWEIGAILSIAATTVKFHVNGARAKLGARTRAQAAARLVLYGLF